jgi:2'-5' RNA ligase
LCNEKDFYYSDIVSSINGDVSYKAHITLFYGFTKEVDEKVIEKHIQSLRIKKIKLGKSFLLPGWKNSYQILCIEILDCNQELKTISDSFKKFDYVEKVLYPDFKPHITLAFVNSDFIIKHTFQIPKIISIKEIKYIKE